MYMSSEIHFEDEESTKRSNIGDNQQGFWFDAGLYREWLVFLHEIWQSVEYL